MKPKTMRIGENHHVIFSTNEIPCCKWCDFFQPIKFSGVNELHVMKIPRGFCQFGFIFVSRKLLQRSIYLVMSRKKFDFNECRECLTFKCDHSVGLGSFAHNSKRI